MQTRTMALSRCNVIPYTFLLDTEDELSFTWHRLND